MIRADLDSPSPDGAVGESPRALSGRSVTVALCAVVALGAIALAAYPLTSPNALFGIHPWPHGYDDGVYLAAAVRLAQGVLPYRDYVFLQPPGIIVTLSPVAMLAHLVGTDGALAAARLLTVGVAGANALLAALIARPRGRLAMLVAGGALALYPLAAAATIQDDLEPYVVLFCLLGIWVAFSRERPTPRRLLVAGLLLGFATAVKLPAALPALMLPAVFVRDWRRARAATLGAIIGFLLPCIIFFSAAPAAAIREVFHDQLSRMDAGVLSVGQRLVLILGLGSPANVDARTHTAEFLTALLVIAVVAISLRYRRTLSPMEWYTLGAATLVMVEMLLARQFYDHYAYFPAALLALVAGVVASRLVRWVSHLLGAPEHQMAPRLAGTLLAIGGLLIATFDLVHTIPYEHRYIAGSVDPKAAVDALIPAGTCAITDEYTILLVVDRFIPARAGCPAVIDPYGMYIADDDGHPPGGSSPPPASFVAVWQRYFSRADAVVLSVPLSSYIAWDTSLINYQNATFRLALQEPNAAVYLRTVRKGL